MSSETRLMDRSLLKRIVRFVVFATAFGFLLYYGQRHWQDVADVIGEFRPLLIISALLFVTASLFCKALMNLTLLRELLHTPMDSVALLHSYTQSQIVKYLPGKIWGVVFQASSLESNVRKSDVWVVSILQIIILNSFAVLVLMATVVFIDSLSLLQKFVVIGGGTLGFALAYFNFGRILKLARLNAATVKKYAGLIDARLARRIFLLLLLDWALYICMWGALAYSNLSFFEVFVTAVNYTTASIVGWLVFFIPSGLVVREAVFIAFGQVLGENLALLVVYSVVARLLFLSGDLLLFLMTSIYKGFNGRPKTTLG